MFYNVKIGRVVSYKSVTLNNGKTKYIVNFSIENEEFVGGTEFVSLWLNKEPYCGMEWKLLNYNFKWIAVEPITQ